MTSESDDPVEVFVSTAMLLTRVEAAEKERDEALQELALASAALEAALNRIGELAESRNDILDQRDAFFERIQELEAKR